MFIVKGFSEYSALRIHRPHEVNIVGELSDRSLTYTREKSVYRDKQIDPELLFISFVSQKDGVLVPIPLTVQQHILEVLKSCWDKTITNPTVELDYEDHINPLIVEFQAVASDFKGGPIVTDETYFMPEWLRWKYNSPDEGPVEIQLWFSDPAFRKQFPESIIVVAPPFDNLDDFFLAGATVEERLNAINATEVTKRLQDAIGFHPVTTIRTELYDYHDPINPARRVPSPWGIGIHGIAGNNLDAIKARLEEYILANSTHDREEWAKILPDIFRRNEHIFVPDWESYAIPNQILQTGIHSSVTDIDNILAVLKNGAEDYSEAHIRRYGVTTGYPYRSLSVMAIGHVENRDGAFKFTDLFPDWIAVTMGEDWNRMSLRTRDWAEQLLKAIHLSETFEEFSDIPEGMMKVIRGDKLYVTFAFENVTYLVLCKSNFN